MRLLVTGATGFVGKTFLATLNPADSVVCLGRTDPGSVDFVETDIGNKKSVEAASKEIKGDFDALVHLAAYVPKKAEDDLLPESFRVNIGGTIALLEAFKGRIKKIIIGSSAEVYDQSRIKDLINEDSPVAPGSYYAATKLASEIIAQTFGKKNGVPITVLRFSVMYGAYDPIARALPNFIRAALKNEDLQVRGADVLRDYIHVTDVVKSIYAALTSEVQGVFNIGTGKGIAIVDAAQAIVQAAGSKSAVRVEEGSGVDIVLNPEKAKHELGFTASMYFPAGLESMIQAYKNV